jgi:Tfp pilus assembly protein FimT
MRIESKMRACQFTTPSADDSWKPTSSGVGITDRIAKAPLAAVSPPEAFSQRLKPSKLQAGSPRLKAWASTLMAENRSHSALGPGSRRTRGFSTIQLVVVVAIATTLTAMALPSVVDVVANVRLRAGVNSLGGLFHECRAVAIKQNKLMTTQFTSLSYGPFAYVKDATLTGSAAARSASDPQVGLGSPMSRVTGISGVSGGPPALTSTQLGFTPQASDPVATFNPRGLPCLYASGTCTANVGFVFYFTDTRPLGRNGWGALSVSPAGRIKVWIWDGSAWGG